MRAIKALRERLRQALGYTKESHNQTPQNATPPEEQVSEISGPFEYQPLQTSDMIRLIVIRPYKHDAFEGIECDVRHIRINEHQYRALSYEWGPATDNDPTILLGGHITVIRRNLFEALLRLRPLVYGDETIDASIWIDALSINQADTLERNHQVHLMGMIYSRATQVLIWLGLTELLSEHALAAINRGAYESYEKTDNVLDSLYPTVLRVCQSAYWNRVWIQQEVYLAKEALIMCGWKQLLYYESFDEILGLAMHEATPGAREISAKIKQSAANALVTRKRVPGINRLVIWLKLACRMDLQASEPRDLIYAMLGISVDCQNGGLRPDYGKPLLDVYLETVVFCGLETNRFRQTLAEKLGLLWNDGMEQNIREYSKKASGTQ